MESEERRTDLPVLLLHNIDASWGAEEIASAVESVNKMKFALRQEGHPVVDVPVQSTNLAGILKKFQPEDHIVLNWCEELPGVPRSDVTVAQLLETMKFSYTGSTPEVLSFSWNKAAVKTLLDENHIATPCWQMLSGRQSPEWDCFPAIVKPAFEHCSNGITTDAVVLNPAELMKRVAFVQDKFQQPALVEDFIDGREFHVTIWGNGSIEMLPPAEMDFSAFNNLKDRLCTFDSKFTPGSLHYEKIEIRIPAALDEHENLKLKQISMRAYQNMGCRDYARIDLRLRNGIFYVLDINPNADISPDTSLAYAAEAAGLTYGILCSRLVNFAAQRHPIYGCREN
jgi:D-alanine-D-alanine ligase